MKTAVIKKFHQRYAISFTILFPSLLFLALMLFVSYVSEIRFGDCF